jgi:hypothetical protein
VPTYEGAGNGSEWDRRSLDRARFDSVDKRLDSIEKKLDEIHDERQQDLGRRRFIIQACSVATGLLGAGWVVIQLARVYVHGL